MDYDFNNVVRITPYSIEYSLDCGENGEMERFLRCFDTADQLFYFASKLHAFDDCYELRVHAILALGIECEYTGWMPGMEFRYIECGKPSNVIFDGFFPEWDH